MTCFVLNCTTIKLDRLHILSLPNQFCEQDVDGDCGSRALEAAWYKCKTFEPFSLRTCQRQHQQLAKSSLIRRRKAVRK